MICVLLMRNDCPFKCDKLIEYSLRFPSAQIKLYYRIKTKCGGLCARINSSSEEFRLIASTCRESQMQFLSTCTLLNLFPSLLTGNTYITLAISRARTRANRSRLFSESCMIKEEACTRQPQRSASGF